MSLLEKHTFNDNNNKCKCDDKHNNDVNDCESVILYISDVSQAKDNTDIHDKSLTE